MTRAELEHLDNLLVRAKHEIIKEYSPTLDKAIDFVEIKLIEERPKLSKPSDDATLKDIFCMGCEYKEQEPKTAHWIDDKCSICGKGIENLIDSREWYKNVTPNYCPFCGARVIESE